MLIRLEAKSLDNAQGTMLAVSISHTIVAAHASFTLFHVPDEMGGLLSFCFTENDGFICVCPTVSLDGVNDASEPVKICAMPTGRDVVFELNQALFQAWFSKGNSDKYESIAAPTAKTAKAKSSWPKTAGMAATVFLGLLFGSSLWFSSDDANTVNSVEAKTSIHSNDVNAPEFEAVSEETVLSAIQSSDTEITGPKQPVSGMQQSEYDALVKMGLFSQEQDNAAFHDDYHVPDQKFVKQVLEKPLQPLAPQVSTNELVEQQVNSVKDKLRSIGLDMDAQTDLSCLSRPAS